MAIEYKNKLGVWTRSIGATFCICICISIAAGQKLKVVTSTNPGSESNGGTYLLIFILGFAVGGLAFWMFRRRLSDNVAEIATPARRPGSDAIVSSPRKPKRKKVSKSGPAINEVSVSVELQSQLDELIKKGRDLYYVSPVFNITDIPVPADFDPLPRSDDDELLYAIEMSNEEIESDPNVREAALATLEKFRCSDSIEAVVEMASYDVCTRIRSKAITALAGFDHETVFEAILLGCADPSREVRAAAARSLMRVTFDRAEAWTRIAESQDSSRIFQAGRAILSGGLLENAVPRLIHPEKGPAAEAFAIIGVLIRSGETSEILAQAESYADPQIRKALLHVIRVFGTHDLLDQITMLDDPLSSIEDISSDIAAATPRPLVEPEIALAR